MPGCWSSPVYKGLIERAASATSQGERLELYRQADRMIVEEAVVMPLAYGRRNVLVKPWVARYPLSPVGAAFCDCTGRTCCGRIPYSCFARRLRWAGARCRTCWHHANASNSDNESTGIHRGPCRNLANLRSQHGA